MKAKFGHLYQTMEDKISKAKRSVQRLWSSEKQEDTEEGVGMPGQCADEHKEIHYGLSAAIAL